MGKYGPSRNDERYVVVKHHEYPVAPYPMCITSKALDQVLHTVGSQPPETGGKAFGPRNLLGIDHFEFDERGSSRANGAIYSPDTQWGDQRLNYWLNQPDDRMKLWTADIHSHPGQFGRPSHKSGKGLGDLGYVEEVLQQNELMEVFFIPILTNTHREGPVEIHPWMVLRQNPHEPLRAEFQVCGVEDFPERPFNPAWEASLKAVSLEATGKRLRELIVTEIESGSAPQSGGWIRVTQNQVVVELLLPTDFPAQAPEVRFPQNDKATRTFPFHWGKQGSDPEVRLKNLIESALAWNATRF